jgi:protease-4
VTLLLLAAGMLLGGTCATCMGGLGGVEGQLFPLEGPRVGVVEVVGPITASKDTVEHLSRFSRDEEIEAVVLRIDSPGGSVGPSQEIYVAVRRTASVKPVLASMGSVAASGGYWVALGAEEIYANPGTITGSIGVIVQTPDLTEVAELLRFGLRTYKSGPHKDLGNPLREPSAGDRAIFQTVVDDVYDQFVDLVAARRALTRGQVQPLADGRIFTGRDAREAGLLDGLGGLETAARRAVALARGTATSTASLFEETPVLVYPPEPTPPLLELLGIHLSDRVAQGLAEGVESGLRKATEPRVDLR